MTPVFYATGEPELTPPKEARLGQGAVHPGETVQEADRKRFLLGEYSRMRVLFVAAQGRAEAHQIKEAIEAALKAQFNHDEARTMAGLFAVAPLPEDTSTMYEQPIWTRPFRQDLQSLLRCV